jgi:hypothetical protein|tara:strand:+ start:80 stop:337 length:258 start_codon:yes stop_codon:yes gene_type:complete
MIDKELERYYESMYSLFHNEGWKSLLSDLKENTVSINSVEHTTDLNDLQFRKGQLSIIASLLNLEEQIRAAEEQALEEDLDAYNG